MHSSFQVIHLGTDIMLSCILTLAGTAGCIACALEAEFICVRKRQANGSGVLTVQCCLFNAYEGHTNGLRPHTQTLMLMATFIGDESTCAVALYLPLFSFPMGLPCLYRCTACECTHNQISHAFQQSGRCWPDAATKAAGLLTFALRVFSSSSLWATLRRRVVSLASALSLAVFSARKAALATRWGPSPPYTHTHLFSTRKRTHTHRKAALATRWGPSPLCSPAHTHIPHWRQFMWQIPHTARNSFFRVCLLIYHNM